MKIINHATLLQQPQGVLFADYEGGGCGELSIYGGISAPGSRDFVRCGTGIFNADLEGTGFNDWFQFWNKHMEKGGEGKPDFECWGRDGLFDDEAKYVLLDREDVGLLLKRVAKSLTEAYGVANPADLL